MRSKRDSLGDRMKEYENIARYSLTRRVPVVIRLDGKAFHTFTRGMRKPFDSVLMGTMQDTMKFLCQNIQGCVLGYTQSDEITLVLTDYATIATDAWFGYGVQKMASVASSMATLAFNRAYRERFEGWAQAEGLRLPADQPGQPSAEALRMEEIYRAKLDAALFDARVFSVPKEEVCNCLIWRQKDATRNSIEAVGYANFSRRELHGKTCDEVQEMLWSQRGINWNDLPVECKRGSCCYRVVRNILMDDPRNPGTELTVTRRTWEIDRQPPIFTQNREYVERWL